MVRATHIPVLRPLFLAPLLALGLVFAPVSGSGDASAQLLTFGAKGGATFASISDADGTFSDVGRRTGSVVGAFAGVGAGTIGLRGEVLLVQKGFSGSQEGTDIEFNIDYVEIPVLLMIRMGAGPVRPAIYGGAAIGFERDCTVSATGVMVVAEGDCDRPEADAERETTELGAVFGAEVMFGLGGISLVVDGRYTMGLTTLDASDDPDEIQNRAFMLMAGLAVPIG